MLQEIKQSGIKTTEERLDGFSYHCINGMFVIQSIATEDDGKRWIHTSFSRKSRVPEYKDIKWIKEVFIGKDRMAIQVFPPKSKHVNIHPFCLHLWTPAAHNPLPDFTQGMRSI